MATRFRLENDAGNAIVPTVGGSYTHESPTSPSRLTEAALSSALANLSYVPDGSDHLSAGDARFPRFISDPMEAGIGFVTSDTVKYAVQCSEVSGNNNLFFQLAIHVISQDGNVLRATIRSKAADTTEMAAVTMTSRTASHNLDGNYTTVSGDRLLVELSATGTPTNTGGVQGHNWTLRMGSSGAGGDLLENDSQTGTTLNPWLEFSRDITFLVIVEEFMGQACISM